MAEIKIQAFIDREVAFASIVEGAKVQNENFLIAARKANVFSASVLRKIERISTGVLNVVVESVEIQRELAKEKPAAVSLPSVVTEINYNLREFGTTPPYMKIMAEEFVELKDYCEQFPTTGPVEIGVSVYSVHGADFVGKFKGVELFVPRSESRRGDICDEYKENYNRGFYE